MPIARIARLVTLVLLVAYAGLFTAWAFLALHYAPLFTPPGGDVVAAALALIGLLAVLRLKPRYAALVCLAGPASVLAWFLALHPSNDRQWQPEYAVLPSVTIDAEIVHITGIRNFAWHSETEATPAYYDASYDLRTLDAVDLIVSHWSSDAIAHVFLSFGFRDGRYLALSVETRRQLGQEYSVLGGFFRSYELFYVIADEKDLIGVRTDMRHESVYIYPVSMTPQTRRLLLLSYLRKVQDLSRHPVFYNTLTDNCTTNIVARAADAAAGSPANRYSWKLLASGYADAYVYESGKLNQSMPFDELKRRSLIRRQPGAGIGPEFSSEIRAQLP
jgi:Domain of unknown function (DUF4105)